MSARKATESSSTPWIHQGSQALRPMALERTKPRHPVYPVHRVTGYRATIARRTEKTTLCEAGCSQKTGPSSREIDNSSLFYLFYGFTATIYNSYLCCRVGSVLERHTSYILYYISSGGYLHFLGRCIGA